MCVCAVQWSDPHRNRKIIAYKFSGEAVFVGDHAKIAVIGGGMGRTEEVGKGLSPRRRDVSRCVGFVLGAVG